MNILSILLISIMSLILGYRIYSRYLSNIYGEDPNWTTPAHKYRDNVDYVPGRVSVVFAHHFASIAGSGPILGPAMAMIYGVIPVWLWIILGGIFIGAVHDYTALFVSMREKGKSIAEISRGTLGKTGFILTISFSILLILLVASAFLSASAISLTSMVSLDQIGLGSDQGVLMIRSIDGKIMGNVGGVVASSVIFITLFAPVIGVLNHKLKMGLGKIVPIGLVICICSLFFGFAFPIILELQTWVVLLGIYSFIAAGIPVWLLLQPRDFLNVFILYGGMIIIAIGVFGVFINGIDIQAPAFNIGTGNQKLGLIWPFLFITVACGAVSGFHGLVAGGTVAKQVPNENSSRVIGYGGMLLESLLAVGVVITLGTGISFIEYKDIVFPDTGNSNPVFAFALALGGLLNKGVGIPMLYGTVFGLMMVGGFMATTLDTAVRINKYLFQELWSVLFKNPPGWLKSNVFNSALPVLLILALAFTNAFTAIWPVFGTANQLLAAFTLIILAAWLAIRRKKNIFITLPAVFMIITTVFSMFFLSKKYLQHGDTLLLITILVMFLLACALIAVAVLSIRKKNSEQLKS